MLSLQEDRLRQECLRESYRPERDLAFGPVERNPPAEVGAIQMDFLVLDPLAIDAIDRDRVKCILEAAGTPIDADPRIGDTMEDELGGCYSEGKPCRFGVLPFDNEVQVKHQVICPIIFIWVAHVETHRP